MSRWNRKASHIAAETLTTVRAIAPTARIVVRADSRFYSTDVVAPATAWQPIHYPQSFVDTDTGELVPDAEVAEVAYTAFTSRPKALQMTGRLTPPTGTLRYRLDLFAR